MIKTADGRKLWLDECLINGTTLILHTEKVEEKRRLTARETNIKQLAAAYCYLYHRIQEEGLLNPGDEDNFFEQENIH